MRKPFFRPFCEDFVRDGKPFFMHVCYGRFRQARAVHIVNAKNKSQYRQLFKGDTNLFLYLQESKDWNETMARLDRWEAQLANPRP